MARGPGLGIEQAFPSARKAEVVVTVMSSRFTSHQPQGTDAAEECRQLGTLGMLLCFTTVVVVLCCPVRLAADELVATGTGTPTATLTALSEASASSSATLTHTLSITYVVQSGDTLAVIAKRFGTTVDQIASTNTITNVDLIEEGQVLTLVTGVAAPEPTTASLKRTATTVTTPLSPHKVDVHIVIQEDGRTDVSPTREIVAQVTASASGLRLVPEHVQVSIEDTRDDGGGAGTLCLLAVVALLLGLGIWAARRGGRTPRLRRDVPVIGRGTQPLPAPPVRTQAPSIYQVDDMTGYRFEAYVRMLLEHQGYLVKKTGGAGDLGVDIVAHRGQTRYAVQVKRYSGPVPRNAVGDAVAGMAVWHCNKSMVVTNSTFSDGAKELARRNGCVLIDRPRLTEWIRDFQSASLYSKLYG